MFQVTLRSFCFSSQFFHVLSKHCRHIRSLRFEFFAERYTNRYFNFDTDGLLALLAANPKVHTLDVENAGFLCDNTVIEIVQRILNVEVLNIR